MFVHKFFHDLSYSIQKRYWSLIRTFDASSFLKIGVTLASFQEEGKEPEDRDEFNREHNWLASSEESSLSILIFIPSAPEDFPS